MYRCLSPGAIGVSASLEDGLRYAQLGGYDGLEVGINDIAQRIETNGKEAMLALFENAGIQPGGWGFPMDWRTSDSEKFDEELKKLSRLAKAGQAIGCVRTFTWIPSWSEEREKETNIEWHVHRFTPIADVLRDHGCSLGLEFLGPKTIRAGKPHEFIYDMTEMLEMADRIGSNVGLLLDCWHWYTAGNTVEQIQQVSPDKIVYVHVNDAPEGVPVEEQKDSVRCLPGETGVINIAGFLQALQKIGYDGPVTPEPFSSQLKGVTPEQAVTMTGDAMGKIWRQAGLS